MESKKLILMIDDEPDFLETMRVFLDNANFRVITAASPEEGLEKTRLKPDLILLDLKMPRLDGHQVCKRIKEDRETLHIPVIMLTSHDKTLDKVEAFDLGVADYIGKQFSFEEILARIKAVLRQTAPETNRQVLEDKSNKIIALRRVIDEKNLRTFFQPIVNISTRTPIGYEALTRGPEGSFLQNPLDLFALAAEADMYVELNMLTLNLAAKRAVFLKADQLLFLNIDPLIIAADFFKNMEFLKGSAISPSQVSIELTERTCIKNFARLSGDLDFFKAMGAKISIDDVGEGYSSLKAIAELKPEFIKIDMGLIRGVDSDVAKRSIIQIMVELAKKLSAQLVAEGIETEEENKTLLAIGVQYGQGYLFARPSEHI